MKYKIIYEGEIDIDQYNETDDLDEALEIFKRAENHKWRGEKDVILVMEMKKDVFKK